MIGIEKTVFISYRRTHFPWALAVFQDLTQHGYDAFLDYGGMGSGNFEQVIFENINTRAHFLALLAPSALDACHEPEDWLRREIEHAIKLRRNIVPLLLEGFDFSKPEIKTKLVGTLGTLPLYNALDIHPAYFSAAMGRLREKHLNVPLQSVPHPVMSPVVEQLTKAQQASARKAPAVSETLLKSAVTAVNVLSAGIDLYNMIPKGTPAQAETRKGFAYENGWHVPKDDIQAVTWYRKAAEAGNATAMTKLGFMYENARGGLPRNEAEAVKWYSKGSALGNERAKEHLKRLGLEP